MSPSVLMATVAALCLSVSVHASECLTMPPDVTDLNGFVERVIDSLESFADARNRLKSLGNAKTADDVVSTLSFAQQDLACAEKRLTGFAKSPNVAVVGAAEGFGASSFILKATTDQTRESFVADMNGTTKAEGPGDRANRLATLRVQAENAWSSLSTAATAVAFALVEFKPESQTQKRMALTTTQRARLAKRLLKDFPIVARRNAPTEAVDTAASILYDFLMSKKWRSHEQPFDPA